MTSSSDEAPGNFAKSEDLLEILRKGRTFAEELLRENERLRYRVLQLEKERLETDTGAEMERLRSENERLRERLETIDQRLAEIEGETNDFEHRHNEIIAQNESLANLYVASYQLHASLDPDDVAQTIGEIVVGLIGARSYAILLREADELVVVGGDQYSDRFPGGRIADPESLEWQVAATGSPHVGEPGTDEEEIAVVPLMLGNNSVGAIGLYSMLSQKTGGFTHIDHELLNLLAGQAAVALVSSRLYEEKNRS